jgi:tRNA threonylcarbamoyladenosine biosynthesis protein TsaB
MNILAIDTCFAACSAAVCVDCGGPAERIAARFEPMQTGHAERLVAMVEEVMREARLSFAALDRIAVTTGPGSFVGTRVGVSAARAFALASGARIVGLSSLAAIARQAAVARQGALAPSLPICVVVDARRDEVYAQLFDSAGVDAQSVPQLLSLTQAIQIESNGPYVYVGTGRSASDDRSYTVHELMLPDARYLFDAARLADPVFDLPAPLYLRPPDAKPPTAVLLQRR